MRSIYSNEILSSILSSGLNIRIKRLFNKDTVARVFTVNTTMWKYTYSRCLYFGVYCLILEGCFSNSSGELTERKHNQGKDFSFAKLRSQFKQREMSQSAGHLPPKDVANFSETRNTTPLSLLNKGTSNLFGKYCVW